MIALAVTLVGCGHKGGADDDADRRAEEHDAPAATAPLAPGVYRIDSLRVDLEPTTKRGIAWDLKPSPDPDPKAVLSIAGRNIAMCRASETLALRCSIGADVEIDADTVLQLQVWDEDALSDDEVGTAELGDATGWALGPELRFATTGRIRRATVRLGAIPTWWQAHGWHLLVLAGGLLVAVGGLVAYRRVIIRLTPAPAPPRRCAHCEALLGAKARVCDHCGARVRA